MTELIAQVNGARDERIARISYREGFKKLSRQIQLYPPSGSIPSVVFESAAQTAKHLAAKCLPLGIAVAMHLYPLCALQCVPLPLMSAARFQRAMLLRTIRNRSLVLANAGSDRVQGAHEALLATESIDGIRIDGTFEYMSLASVADMVLFKAPLINSNCTVLCAADLRADSVRIGKWKFSGSMRLSDTASVTFSNHLVRDGRYVLVSNDQSLCCISDYQRCWFHLLLAELYLARLARLHHIWTLQRPEEQLVSLNEVARLREYSLRLLDDFASRPDIEALIKTTSAMKLRVSMMAQTMMAALRSRADSGGTDAQQLQSDASELGFIKSQPTADQKILQSLGAVSFPP